MIFSFQLSALIFLLARRFGQHGEDLARHARGIDARPIVTERAAKSISQETTEES